MPSGVDKVVNARSRIPGAMCSLGCFLLVGFVAFFVAGFGLSECSCGHLLHVIWFQTPLTLRMSTILSLNVVFSHTILELLAVSKRTVAGRGVNVGRSLLPSGARHMEV